VCLFWLSFGVFRCAGVGRSLESWLVIKDCGLHGVRWYCIPVGFWVRF